MGKVTDFIFLGSKITVGGDCIHEIKTLGPWKKRYDKSRQCIKKQRHHFADKVCIVKASVLAWRIPGTAEPGGLPSMGSHRVGHD